MGVVFWRILQGGDLEGDLRLSSETWSFWLVGNRFVWAVENIVFGRSAVVTQPELFASEFFVRGQAPPSVGIKFHGDCSIGSEDGIPAEELGVGASVGTRLDNVED